MQTVAKHIVFSGRVQGVGFRFTAHRIALRYDLTGFVKNLPDGSVEMLAQGAADDVKDCLRDISESFIAYIRDTKIEDTPLNPQYNEFKISF
jgi:acylphosphatase